MKEKLKYKDIVAAGNAKRKKSSGEQEEKSRSSEYKTKQQQGSQIENKVEGNKRKNDP